MAGWTIPDGSVVPSATSGGYVKQESGILRRSLQWGDDDEDGYPLGREPLPLAPLGTKQPDSPAGIVRKVDVDVTYHHNLGQGISSDSKAQSAKETV